MIDLHHLELCLGQSRHELRRLVPAYRRRVLRHTGRELLLPSRELKAVQKRLHQLLSNETAFPGFMHGGIPGRSALTNAAVHVRKKFVLSLDIQGCFASITRSSVERALVVQAGVARAAARVIARLCTAEDRLPTGAATSVLLANLVLLPLCQRLSVIAERNDLAFTSFIDDFTFSGSASPHRLVNEIVHEMRRAGFRPSREKTKIQSHTREQVVTGVRVNNGLQPVSGFRIALARDLLLQRRGKPQPQAQLAGRRSFLQSIIAAGSRGDSGPDGAMRKARPVTS